MKIEVYANPEELALGGAQLLKSTIEKNPEALFCFAAGSTQIPTYNLLVQWAKEGEVDMSRLRIIGLDEIVGAKKDEREGFHYFLDKHLFGPVGIKGEQVFFMDAQAGDIAAECAKVDAWLDANGPIDVLVLGIGGNGHIGYNEPGADPTGRTHAVELEQSSVAAGQTYFDHAFEANQGITLGLQDLVKAKHILVQATGEKKASAIAALRAGKVTRQIPVTLLLEREAGVVLHIDEAASNGKG